MSPPYTMMTCLSYILFFGLMQMQRHVVVSFLSLRNSPIRVRHTFSHHGFHGNGKVPPKTPPSRRSSSSSWDDFSPNNQDDERYTCSMILQGCMSHLFCSSSCEDSTSTEDDTNAILECDSTETPIHPFIELHVRGGGGEQKKSNNNVTSKKVSTIWNGTKVSIRSSLSYWSSAFQGAFGVLTTPLRQMQTHLPFLGTKRNKIQEEEVETEEAKILRDLQSIIVTDVTAPNATTLPKEIVRIAAKRSGLLGGTLRSDSVHECAKLIKQWYLQRGFILNAVTGATLIPEQRTAVLSVQEPIVSDLPVGITFTKELVIDPETNQPMTYREYRQYHSRRRTNRHNILSKKDMNTTIVQTTGRTRPYVVAKALRLLPGSNFCWDVNRWEHIRSSGLFSRILRASPERMRDGTVQLHIVAQEAPPRNLEYGVSRSLYTGSWEGELDFLHGNILGGGETLGLVVRRGAKDPEPSVRLRFRDDKFGLEGGYDVELFNDYVAVDTLEGTEAASNLVDTDVDATNLSRPSSSNPTADEPSVKVIDSAFDEGALISRKGATLRLRDPFSVPFIPRSTLATSLERTSTRTGKHEEIGSVTLDLGPFESYLPLDARGNILTSYTVGTRFYEHSASTWNRQLLPYSSAMATSRQVFPLTNRIGQQSEPNRPVELAFQHSVMSSTRNLPRHEANAAGIASRVRGQSISSNGPVSRYIAGTTELRIPILLPMKQAVQDGRVVLFGDWMVGERRSANNFIGQSRFKSGSFRNASIGIGLRKSIQGLPIKYDLCLTSDKKIGSFFTLGLDFDV